jgi:glycosyltransferase involved in cell wall biosynthesis
MKLLVFAHTPPPHHGQSYMVQLMLDGFGGDHRRNVSKKEPGSEYGIECYHVNARLSKEIHEIGGFHPRKLFLLARYCGEAIWCRFRYGVTSFYYVPAPGHRAALYRDWVVMLLCRPFFKNITFHWHAAGLTEWLETSTPGWVRWVTQKLCGRPEQSIILSRYNNADGVKLRSGRIDVVHNGIADCCPDFENRVLPRRTARCRARQKFIRGEALTPVELEHTGPAPEIFKVLYVAHCSRAKGLFDAVEAVAAGNGLLAKNGHAIRIQLTVAGDFVSAVERTEFEARIKAPDLRFALPPTGATTPSPVTRVDSLQQSAVLYVGFLGGEQKSKAFIDADCFCLPTFYSNENQPVTLLEAMSYGLPIVTTRWRSLPELFPAGYLGLVDIQSCDQIAETFVKIMYAGAGYPLREIFLNRFTITKHLTELAQALTAIEERAEEG